MPWIVPTRRLPLKWWVQHHLSPLTTTATTFLYVFFSFLKWKWKSLSHVRLLATPWTVAHHGSSVHDILQARILRSELPCPPPRESSQPTDWILVSCITSRFFTVWATWAFWLLRPTNTLSLAEIWGFQYYNQETSLANPDKLTSLSKPKARKQLWGFYWDVSSSFRTPSF